MNVIVPDPTGLERLKSRIKKGGYGRLHVLSDFDRTLTYGSVNGVETPSIICMLRDGNHLADGYAEKASMLFSKYHRIETDPFIPMEEKKKAMQEWWNLHIRLMIDCGLSRKDLEDIAVNGKVEFRKGVAEFMEFLHVHGIPLIILSASGCGDAVQIFLEKKGMDHPNIFYVTNRFTWNAEGRAVAARGPVIHCMNKDETVIKDMPDVCRAVRGRENVLLMGDSLGDLGMACGFDSSSMIRVGFLNSDCERCRKSYEENFDVVLEGDGDFSYINRLVRDLG